MSHSTCSSSAPTPISLSLRFLLVLISPCDIEFKIPPHCSLSSSKSTAIHPSSSTPGSFTHHFIHFPVSTPNWSPTSSRIHAIYSIRSFTSQDFPSSNTNISNPLSPLSLSLYLHSPLSVSPLSICLFVSVYVSVSVIFCLCLYLCLCLSVYLSPSVSLSVCMSVCISLPATSLTFPRQPDSALRLYTSRKQLFRHAYEWPASP